MGNIRVVIGHRGVGKSSFAKRLRAYLKRKNLSSPVIDLDQWIEIKECRKVQEIFDRHGEKYFRDLEQDYFKTVLSDLEKFGSGWIFVGGGFDVSLLPAELEVLWLQRETDKFGRIFLNRPRLDKGLSPLDEYKKRWEIREPKFLSAANETLIVPEGLTEPNIYEEKIIFSDISHLGGTITLLPEVFISPTNAKQYLTKRLSWGLSYFEVRNDLLSLEHQLLAGHLIPKDRIIYSYRQGNIEKAIPDAQYLDWPLEMGEPKDGNINLISLHARQENESITSVIKKISKYARPGRVLKLAVPVNNYEELELGHLWHLEDPKSRSFLPMSKNGRWGWYRLLNKNQFPINFIREGRGSAFDQPTLMNWLSFKESFKQFAAVLGSPVSHSFSPIEHFDFFEKNNMNIFAVDITEAEFPKGIQFLNMLGLRAAAVTSPLKELAFKASAVKSAMAEEFKSANTLFVKENEFICENTDYAGFLEIIKLVQGQSTVVWGGGGTLEMMRKAIPQAQFYSSRSGQPRDGSKKIGSPQVLIWAAPRAEGSMFDKIPQRWKPELIIDLNYKEDSPGLEFAAVMGAHYISGLEMFQKQAEQQRAFWEKQIWVKTPLAIS